MTAQTDLKDLAKEIIFAATANKNLIVEGLQTATENLINFKGLEDRIAKIIDMVESREEFLVETIAKMHDDFAKGFKAVSIRYGRRLIIRGESEILREIKEAKQAGMPTSHIESLMMELIYTRYKNNKVELERNRLLAELEPLNGYTVEEIGKLSTYVTTEDLQIKFNFNRIVDIFEAESGPINLFKPEKEWKKRILGLYEKFKKINNEVLHSQGNGGQDGDPPVQNSEGD